MLQVKRICTVREREGRENRWGAKGKRNRGTEHSLQGI